MFAVRELIRTFQHRLREAWFPIAVSALMLAIFSVFGLAAGEVQEVLSSYVGANSTFDWLRASVTFLAILVFALTMRHWTARLLWVDIHAANGGWLGWATVFVIIAWYAPWIGAALSFAQAHAAVGGALSWRDPGAIFGTSFGVLAVAALVFPALFAAIWWMPAVAERRHRLFCTRAVRWTSTSILPLAFLGLAGFFLVMPPEAVEFARAVGPVPLVCLSLSVLTVAGCFLIAWSRKHGFPAFTIVALTPVLVGALGWDDNHFIRRLSRESDIPRPELSDAISAFADANPRAPIVLVSTEGGGIRAAHFTAMVLARLADQCPSFASRIFAVDGVSGGAIGAAAYRASLDAMPMRAGPCDLAADRPPGPREMALNNMLSRDHLSPVLAKMAFPEVVQTFLPASAPHADFAFAPGTDRQLGLELSFEQAFAHAFALAPGQTNPMEQSAFQENRPPYLIVNMTSVSTGGDYAASSLDLSGVRREHPWLRDFRCVWSARENGSCERSPDFRLSTIAATSARFPVISPAGTARRTQNSAYRFVDGGYFDNSGIEAVLAIVDHLRARPDFERNILPRLIILHIDSNPYPAQPESAGQPPPRLDLEIHELQAVLATREERVRMSFNQLENLQREGRVCNVVLVEMDRPRDVSLRLGWILSNAAAAELQRQAAIQLERHRDEGAISLGACRGPRAPTA